MLTPSLVLCLPALHYMSAVFFVNIQVATPSKGKAQVDEPSLLDLNDCEQLHA